MENLIHILDNLPSQRLRNLFISLFGPECTKFYYYYLKHGSIATYAIDATRTNCREYKKINIDNLEGEIFYKHVNEFVEEVERMLDNLVKETNQANDRIKTR